ncbi:MAG: AAA family ATPase, partial [Sphingobacteriales bacterium]|nr:AAA family ATPase [Sphingobacteriales bacterium]
MPQLIIEARSASLTTGLGVRRILPFRQRRMVGPFIFMDHAGPVDIQPVSASLMDVLPPLFAELKKEHGSVEITQVTRQKVDWQREAAQDLSDGRFEEALRAFARNKAVVWTSKQ